MSPFEVVPDFVVGSHSDPVGHLPVLLGLAGEFPLESEGLVRSHWSFIIPAPQLKIRFTCEYNF